MAEENLNYDSSSSEEIVIIVENEKFTCKKFELIKHSDYFKAMFEGNFLESTQNSITLREVDAKALKIILILLWDCTYVIREEDVLLVLETAFMLQFSNIAKMLLNRLLESLSPSNCLEIWFVTENFNLEDLYLKAKYLAMVEFKEIKNMKCVLDLNFQQLHFYLSDVNLKCSNELDVYLVCMKWWNENSRKGITTKNDLFTLLSVLDYKTLSDVDLREMLSYPDICEFQEIRDFFTYLIALKTKKESYLFKDLRHIVSQVLNGSHRVERKVPCLLVQIVFDQVQSDRNGKGTIESNLNWTMTCEDKFKRKRHYAIVNNQVLADRFVIYYDLNTKKFDKLLEIDNCKCNQLDGFKILCYKEFLFLFGGEVKIGRGDWNRNFWVYDNIKEKWQRKSVMPQDRRHFESCMVNEYLFIVGGVGVYRIIQDNMLWYNYKNDLWSKVTVLPCPGRHIKCCEFNDKFFLLNVNGKCGYFFEIETYKWIDVSINNPELVPVFHDKFSIFSYNGSLFFKGNQLIETKLEGYTLNLIDSKEITNLNYDSIDCVLSDNIVYSLYKRKTDECFTVTLETLCLDNYNVEYIFKDLEENSYLSIENGEKFKVGQSSLLFNFHHWKMMKGKNFINQFAASSFS